ncbi:hypothetical protein [Actinacidiphila oryziradicis]|uniref:hypothetical protein n=1 Tax=Actinacidiphila oryziradicis TaxID=2571141 RepID=UPI0023EFC125|nr:hypothetical protein [Actinacidiphila oryziradicis]
MNPSRDTDIIKTIFLIAVLAEVVRVRGSTGQDDTPDGWDQAVRWVAAVFEVRTQVVPFAAAGIARGVVV